ncbi:MAG TPA: agmatinase, partial [Blastocatellia bacterium]|nr:agmatinase [Blastocatellia bacterium]
RGAAEAPALIRAALFSPASNPFSESGVAITREALPDAGDIVAVSGEAMLQRIEAGITELLDQGFSPISLGGDHAITFPIMRAYAKRYRRLSILHFDAHPDLYDELDGNRWSHACPFARIMEEGLVERLVQVGIRTLTDHQRQQVERFGVEVIEMRDYRDDWPIDFDTPVYISFDVDGLDPAFAPGVSHREPGGLSSRQAINTILNLNAEIVGADIVEFNPRMDVANLTETVCAKIVKEIAAQMLGQYRDR